MDEGTIILPAPDLSDEAAYYLLEFFVEVSSAIERHYAPQLTSYYRKTDPEYEAYLANKTAQGPQDLQDPNLGDEEPF
jgi:hypothetical protein